MRFDIEGLKAIAQSKTIERFLITADYLMSVHDYIVLLENTLSNSRDVLSFVGDHEDAVAYIDFLLINGGKRDS